MSSFMPKSTVKIVRREVADKQRGIELFREFADAPVYYKDTPLIRKEKCLIYNHQNQMLRFVDVQPDNVIVYFEVLLHNMFLGNEQQAVTMIRMCQLHRKLYDPEKDGGKPTSVYISQNPDFSTIAGDFQKEMQKANCGTLDFLLAAHVPVEHIHITIGASSENKCTYTEKQKIKVALLTKEEAESIEDDVAFKDLKSDGIKYVMVEDDLDTLFLFSKHGVDSGNSYTRDQLAEYHYDSQLVFHDSLSRPIPDPKICRS